MPRDGNYGENNGLSELEAMIETVIASLKWLADACRRGGLGKYADILDDAFGRCLQLYILEQREKLADSLEDEDDQSNRKLN